MDELLARLYETLQRLKQAAPHVEGPGGRWYTARRGRDLDGPFQAAELAWQVHAGLLDPDDDVIHGASGDRRRVGLDPFLRGWRGADETARARLARALTNAVRARADALATPAGRAAAGPRLSAEQERAYRLLRLDPGCSPGEAKARLRALVSQHHPDRGGSVERMQEINWAWGVVARSVGRV